jgi:hypothetical protein
MTFVTVMVVAVLLITLGLVALREPSRYNEQFIVLERLSTAVNLNGTEDDVHVALAPGMLSWTSGGVVSTVNALVTLVFVFPESSAQETDHVWDPSAKPDTVVVVGEPLGDATPVTLSAPSIVRLQSRDGSRLSVAVQLNVIEVDEVFRLGIGSFRSTDGAAVSTVKVLVALVFELPESSTHVTFQV